MKPIKNFKIQCALVSSFVPSDMMALCGARHGMSYRRLNKIFKRLNPHYRASLKAAYLAEVAYCRALDI